MDLTVSLPLAYALIYGTSTNFIIIVPIQRYVLPALLELLSSFPRISMVYNIMYHITVSSATFILVTELSVSNLLQTKTLGQA